MIAYLAVDQVSALLPLSFAFAAGAMLALVAIEVLPDALRGDRALRSPAPPSERGDVRPERRARRLTRDSVVRTEADRWAPRSSPRAVSTGLSMNDYPIEFSVEFPDRELNRLTTFFRIFTVIPIAIVMAAITGFSTNYQSARARA